MLWFAGGAHSVGDLRKIPGLISHEKEEVEKINEKVHDRRLVEAVIARRGPLVGKTVKQVRFRTRYGAAVIVVKTCTYLRVIVKFKLILIFNIDNYCLCKVSP